jgi:hypothetical protein
LYVLIDHFYPIALGTTPQKLLPDIGEIFDATGTGTLNVRVVCRLFEISPGPVKKEDLIAALLQCKEGLWMTGLLRVLQ